MLVKHEPQNWTDDDDGINDDDDGRMLHKVNSDNVKKQVAEESQEDVDADSQKVLKVLYGESLVDKKAVPKTKSRVSCDQCNKTFRGSYELKLHKKSRHNKTKGNSETFECELCSKHFAVELNLKKHLEMVHVQIRAYKCDQCEKTFKTAKHLARHKKGHLGLKVHCDICDKEFTRTENLAQHKRTVHRDKSKLTAQQNEANGPVKKFTCDECGKVRLF